MARIEMKNQLLVDYLQECGVCQICQLRYLKARGTEYKDVQASLAHLNVHISTGEGDATNGAENENGTACKRPRLDANAICPTCLGLFSAEFREKLLEGILASDIRNFECDQIVVAINLPMLLQIRQLSMWFALLGKFEHGIDKNRAPDVPIKEAIKLILNPTICERLQREYNVNGLTINIGLQHQQETAEVAALQQLNDVAFPSVRKGKRQAISRGVLEKQYVPTQISAKLFAEHIPCPPPVPATGLTLGSISLQGPIVCVAGRYRKYCRDLSHTPWVLNGKRVMEDSIEEILIRTVAPHFCKTTSKVIFMSSGREDVDVRCLGKGRPFVLEIPNAIRTSLSRQTAYEMEQAIASSVKVSVRDLQVVQRDELVHIKTGEEKKRKFYRALCVLQQPATPELMEKLNLPDGFEIQQKTPIRVLHRRPLHTRPRMIYSLKAYVQPDNHRVLVLDVVSQAGTYIKELVHGEFGRTSPSVASLIGLPIDIAALDVVAIDLDWPNDVDNSPTPILE